MNSRRTSRRWCDCPASAARPPARFSRCRAVERHPILDGNAKRVLARVFGIDGRSELAGRSQSAVVAGGGVHPRPARRCLYAGHHGSGRDPLHPHSARLHGLSDDRGLRRRARRAPSGAAGSKAAACPQGARSHTLDCGNRPRVTALAVLLERRPAPGIWGGLWSPPQFEDESAALEWCRREIGDLESTRVLEPDRSRVHAFRSALEPFEGALQTLLGRARSGAIDSGTP